MQRQISEHYFIWKGNLIKTSRSLEVELSPEWIEQLSRVVIDVAEGDAVHGEPVKGDNTVRRVDDSVF